jgi:hypothetical protein
MSTFEQEVGDFYNLMEGDTSEIIELSNKLLSLLTEVQATEGIKLSSLLIASIGYYRCSDIAHGFKGSDEDLTAMFCAATELFNRYMSEFITPKDSEDVN